MKRFDIINIFPHIFDSYFSESIIKRAVQKKKARIKIYNLRDFTKDKHRQVDDRPFGGGAGMVLMAEPILRAVQKIASSKRKKTKIVLFSAKGKQFDQRMAYEWSKKYDNFIFIGGRYEGIDERVGHILKAEEVSIGPYVMTDGDVAAMVVISALVRLIPNVINWSSLEDESYMRDIIKKEAKRGPEMLEYPHYTRPEILEYKKKKYRVPKVLLSGNHQEIEKWRRGQKKHLDA